MQAIERELRGNCGEKWEKLCTENGVHLLLWMVDEAGEVGDVIRKQELEESEVRRHFVEEMCDVMMYFNDLMNCFGISSDELAEQYRAKHRRNMTRRKNRRTACPSAAVPNVGTGACPPKGERSEPGARAFGKANKPGGTPARHRRDGAERGEPPNSPRPPGGHRRVKRIFSKNNAPLFF